MANENEIKSEKILVKDIFSTMRVLQQENWTPVELEANHRTVLNKILRHYRISNQITER